MDPKAAIVPYAQQVRERPVVDDAERRMQEAAAGGAFFGSLIGAMFRGLLFGEIRLGDELPPVLRPTNRERKKAAAKKRARKKKKLKMRKPRQ